MGYLDQDGLAYLWQKIKKALAGKQDSITTGDGLSKDGDTIDLDNPVRGIYTQEEFNALTEEQQASGTYFVDDGSGGGAGQVYSTEEVRIGTWIDGKPLYRRVFTGNINNSSGAWTMLSSFTDSVTPCILNVYGLDSTTGYLEPLPTTAGSGTAIAPTKVAYFSGQGISFYNTGTWYIGYTVIAILEYTKSTDPTPTQEVIN